MNTEVDKKKSTNPDHEKILKDNEVKVSNSDEIINIDDDLDDSSEKIDISKTEMGRYNYFKENKKDVEVKKRSVLLWSKRLFFMFLSAVLFNFGALAFLRTSGTIPSGISGISVLITILADQSKPYFALMYLATNIPLFLIYGFKIKRSFMILTLSFMVFQILSNLIFTLKDVEDFIHKHINISPGWESTIKVNNVVLENPVQWPIFVNGIIGSLFLGVSIAIAWKFGGSTGGTDIIAHYFSTKKKKSIKSILMIVSIASTFTFLLIFAFADPHKNFATLDNNSNKYVDSHSRLFIGMREVTTIMYIFIVNTLIGIMYPKYKKVTLEISCPNPRKVLRYFREIKYWHAYTLIKTISGYSGKPGYKIETTMLLLETRNIIRDLKILDPSLWIRIIGVRSVWGRFNTGFVDD